MDLDKLCADRRVDLDELCRERLVDWDAMGRARRAPDALDCPHPVTQALRLSEDEPEVCTGRLDGVRWLQRGALRRAPCSCCSEGQDDTPGRLAAPLARDLLVAAVPLGPRRAAAGRARAERAGAEASEEGPPAAAAALLQEMMVGVDLAGGWEPRGELLCFVDYLSLPQRGTAGRADALREVPRVLLRADVLLHLEGDAGTRPAGPGHGCPQEAAASPWAALGRIISMVKVAMVGEEAARRLVLARAPGLLHAIGEGGRRLQDSAAAEESLHLALASLQEELEAAVAGSSLPDDEEARLVPELARRLTAGLAQPGRWREEARLQRRRALFLAAARDDAVLCEHLLEAAAEPDFPRGDGATCLHLAAEAGAAEVLRVLLRYSADPSRTDAQGDAPAHLLRLRTDEETLVLFDLLAPTREVLLLANGAGVTPLQRLAYWAIAADGNQPYPPARDHAFFLRGCFPDLLWAPPSRPAPVAAIPGLLAADPTFDEDRQSLQRRTCTVVMDGSTIRTHIWEASGDPAVHVLFLGYGSLLPWCMQKPAMNLLAAVLCPRHNARLVALNPDRWPGGQIETLDDFLARLARVIRVLPLEEPFVLVCGGTGMTAPLLWELRPHLAGALILNPSGFHGPAYLGSRAQQLDAASAESLAEGLAARRVAQAKRACLSERTFVATVEDAAGIAFALDSAYFAAAPQFWGAAAASARWAVSELTETMQRLPMLDLPAVVACGAYADRCTTQESAMRLQRLLPSASLAYIPESKVHWELEGVEQQIFVAGLVDSLVEQVHRDI